MKIVKNCQWKTKNYAIDYQLIQKPIKNYYMKIIDNEIVVSVPLTYNQAILDRLLDTHIVKMDQHLKQRKTFNNYDIVHQWIFYLGTKISFSVFKNDLFSYHFSHSSQNQFKLDIQSPLTIERTIQQLINDLALMVLTQRFMLIRSRFPDFNDATLKIRSYKTKWGSCNCQSREITLNTKLIHERLEIIDYVIYHEFCHFYQANHSKAYYQVLEHFVVNHKALRKELNGGYKHAH